MFSVNSAARLWRDLCYESCCRAGLLKLPISRLGVSLLKLLRPSAFHADADIRGRSREELSREMEVSAAPLSSMIYNLTTITSSTIQRMHTLPVIALNAADCPLHQCRSRGTLICLLSPPFLPCTSDLRAELTHGSETISQQQRAGGETR